MLAPPCEHLTLPRLSTARAVYPIRCRTAAPRMQRGLNRSEASTHVKGSSQLDALKAAGITRDDGAWLGSGMVLTCGGFLPSLVLCACAQQVLALAPLWRLGLFMCTDALFGATSLGFLIAAETFGMQRLQGAQAMPYPGPWREASGQRRMPKFFSPYLLALPMAVGTLLPSAVIALSLLLGDQGLLAATCLAPYMLTLLCQIWMEGVFIQRRSFMWPMVPVVHMLYRLWQLGRGGALVAVLNGPVQLQYIQALLAIVWVLNFGAVMTWMPWLYQWHLQPPAEKPAD